VNSSKKAPMRAMSEAPSHISRVEFQWHLMDKALLKASSLSCLQYQTEQNCVQRLPHTVTVDTKLTFFWGGNQVSENTNGW
jgi:hypothetical protein